MTHARNDWCWRVWHALERLWPGAENRAGWGAAEAGEEGTHDESESRVPRAGYRAERLD